MCTPCYPRNISRESFYIVFYLFEITDNSRAHPVYPELVALIGANVPDYRGLFLRSYGSQNSYHYGTVTHSSAGLGQLQGDAIREIWGDILTGAVEEDAAFLGAFRSAEIGRGGGRRGRLWYLFPCSMGNTRRSGSSPCNSFFSLSHSSEMIGTFIPHTSVSGTSRGCRILHPKLRGCFPPRIRWPDQLSLWRCWPLERRTR